MRPGTPMQNTSTGAVTINSQRHWLPFHPHVLNFKEKRCMGDTISQLSTTITGKTTYQAARLEAPA